MTEEIWKDIPGYEGLYKVSSLGNVMSFQTEGLFGKGNAGRLMAQHPDKCGYMYVELRNKHKKRQKISVHRLVAITFIPNPDNLPQVNHKDEIRDHNNVDNLEWCSVLYNQRYGHRRERSSISSTGENNPRAILTENDVLEIRQTYAPGDKEYGVRGLSEKYGVAYVTIQKIVQGKLWKHLLEEENKNDHKGTSEHASAQGRRTS